MATTTPLAYNIGSPIAGTSQIGTLAIGITDQDYSSNPGGVPWWMGPDEELGYVIAIPVPGNTQPTPFIGVTASVGFYRSDSLTENSFVELTNNLFAQSFTGGNEAATWLNDNGYWTSYVVPVICDSFTFNSINADTTTTSAVKTSGGGWDASAYSVETYTNPVTLTFQTTANGNILMGGFSYNPTANVETYVNISYGIYLQNNFIEIYENGNQVNVPGSITTLSTDVWKVEYNGTNVTYYKNNVLLYTSSNPVIQPLHTFFALYTPAEGVNNVCLTEVLPNITPTPTSTTTITPTPTTTITPTPSVTNTQTPSVTPTLTPTPSTSPVPVTGYGYNLVVLPYNVPTSGNTIFPTFATPGDMSGTTNPNTFTTNGVYWNAIDNLGFNRSNYFSGMTGVSVTAYFTQNGDTSIYSGSTTAFGFEGPPGQESFNYNPNTRPNQLVLIQSASTNFVTGQTVYISYVVN